MSTKKKLANAAACVRIALSDWLSLGTYDQKGYSWEVLTAARTDYMRLEKELAKKETTYVSTLLLDALNIPWETCGEYLFISIQVCGAKDKENHGHYPCKQVILDAKQISIAELEDAFEMCGIEKDIEI